MSFFPRFVSHDFPRFVASDLTPVWRLIDDYANQTVSARNSDCSPARQYRSFNPRFDVREVEGAYELKGELPGVDQKNVEIEFPDQQTVVIKGSTSYSRDQGQPQTQEPAATAAEAAPEATPSETSHQPTVEDEPEIIESNPDAETGSVTPVEQTPASTPETQVRPVSKQQEVDTGRYWVSERYTGSFQRTFSFPAPVDTENATARLRNGVLEVNIPKVQKTGIKRINIE